MLWWWVCKITKRNLQSCQQITRNIVFIQSITKYTKAMPRASLQDIKLDHYEVPQGTNSNLFITPMNTDCSNVCWPVLWTSLVIFFCRYSYYTLLYHAILSFSDFILASQYGRSDNHPCSILCKFIFVLNFSGFMSYIKCKSAQFSSYLSRSLIWTKSYSSRKLHACLNVHLYHLQNSHPDFLYDDIIRRLPTLSWNCPEAFL